MILATIENDSPDGRLVVLSADRARYLPADSVAPNLLKAVENWEQSEGELKSLAAALARNEGMDAANVTFKAPLPRTWQWLDGSAFSTHGTLMQTAFGMDPIDTDRPLMYQGVSDRFYGPLEPIPFRSEDDGIDFEGEFGVIVDAVPMGTTAAEARTHIKLLVQINDWSLRTIAPIEMKTGFGWIQAKPPCSVAPFAITPDELGPAWQECRVGLDLEIHLNGEHFGHANASGMDIGFDDLIAHAAATRDLVAGTIIGSGTISNPNYEEVGSSCISERRAIEMIASGAPTTGYMQFGDRIRMGARTTSGELPFGEIEQRVIAASST